MPSPRDRKERFADAPLVSVVIPCYNQAHFLGEAIESVLAQSYPHFEILVVDDGSTDNTSEVAARYTGVRCIRQDNQGPSAARNSGIRESRGSYLVFLDADDRLLPEALEVGVEYLKAHPECAFATGRYREIAADGSPFSVWEQPEQPCPDEEHYLEMLRGNYIIELPAVGVYRRSIVEFVGGFDTSLTVTEDYELYLRIARSFPVYCHDKLVAEYRQHPSSLTHRNSAMMLKTMLAVLHSERGRVKGSKRYEEAIDAGIKVAKESFGTQLAYEVLAHARKREWRRAVSDLLVLARYYPEAFLRVWLRLLRLAARPLRSLGALWRPQRDTPPVGRVRFGSLRRLVPVSRQFGFDRGRPVDRYYIENFIARQADDIQGHVLEIKDDTYTRKYGGSRVKDSDVLDVTEDNPQATLVADLVRAPHVPSDTFDCVICTQTLHHIYDARSAVQTLYRILKPGGVLLVTVRGISPIDQDTPHWYWAFTAQAARRLFEESFTRANVEVEAYGNVLTATSLLYGLAVEELRQEELDYFDPSYEVSITVRAIKPEAQS